MSYIIYCPQCNQPCGKQYPDSGPTYSSGGEQGYSEGVGENFVYRDKWHCSEKCKQKSISDDGEWE